MLYDSDSDSLTKLTPRLTSNYFYPSIYSLVGVKVVHDSTIAVLRYLECTTNLTLLTLLLYPVKIFNVKKQHKYVCLNDPLSKIVSFADGRFF